jgi:hypothetical protein
MTVNGVIGIADHVDDVRQAENSPGSVSTSAETGGTGGGPSNVAGLSTQAPAGGTGASTGGGTSGGGGGTAAGGGGTAAGGGGTGGGAGTGRSTRAAQRTGTRPRALRRYAIPPTVKIATWVQGLADWERRGGQSVTPSGVVDAGSRTNSRSIQGGVDVIWNSGSPLFDLMMVGLVGSYTDANISANIGANGHLEGTGIGGYWMTSKGPWSVDIIEKVDFFEYTPNGPITPMGLPSSLYLRNYATAGNVNYRIPLGFRNFIEPTAGIIYVATDFDQAILGFDHGKLVRLQAGARIGSVWDWYGIGVAGTFKTLVYSNVEATGPTLQAPGLGLGPGFASSTDQGKIRGDVEGSLNFLFANGYSALVAGSVRFGSEYLATGGRLTVRKEFNAAGVPAAPVYRAPSVLPSSWVWEAGGRYWYSSAKNWYDFYSNRIPSQLNSRLTYDGLAANSGEGFFRVDSPLGMFLKGYFGGGSIFNGHLYDEDFPPNCVYSQTLSDLKGSLGYASVDAGYTFYDGRKTSAFVGPVVRLGAFIGFHYWHEQVDAFGCTQLANSPACAAALPNSIKVITEDDRWNALRLGVVADLWLTSLLKLTTDVAYARVWQRAVDTHYFTVGSDPSTGTGNGLHAEAVLNYQLTPLFDVGVGGRWWHYNTDATDALFNSNLKYTTDRYGVFVQSRLKFGELAFVRR